MPEPRYGVLIRTFNSANTIGKTISCLEEQIIPPSEYIVIDSGSTDRTRSMLPAMAAIFDYEGRSFNYSASLNQGIAIARSAYLLVISSHTSLPHPGAMAYALDLLERDATLGGAYFAFEAAGTLGAARIDRGNFTGFNGMFNTCGLYRTALVRQRPFRPEVFAAEDQEWSRWLLRETGMSIAKIAGSGVRYDNPAGYTAAKRWKEWTAVALYARPEMRRLLQIARVAYRGLRPYPPQSAAERAFNLRLAGFLLRHVDLTGLW